MKDVILVKTTEHFHQTLMCLKNSLFSNNFSHSVPKLEF